MAEPVNITDNLHSLHRHEEELRVQSLQVVNARSDLRDHLQLTNEAMNVIFAFSHDHPYQSDDELTLQMLGIRLFNAAGVALKLGLSGYYQKAFDAVRDILETSFLIDYLRTYPKKIAEWKAANKKARIAHFRAGVIRDALDRRDGYSSGARKKIYDLLSEHASHASYPGFNLVVNAQNFGQVGPFFDEKKLAACLWELAARLGHAASLLTADPEGDDRQLLGARQHYVNALNTWRAKHLSATPTVL